MKLLKRSATGEKEEIGVIICLGDVYQTDTYLAEVLGNTFLIQGDDGKERAIKSFQRVMKKGELDKAPFTYLVWLEPL